MCKMTRMSLEADSKPFNREFWKPENPDPGPAGWTRAGGGRPTGQLAQLTRSQRISYWELRGL